MSLRLRLEFAPELVTADMAQTGLHKCWYEARETTKTIGELAREMALRFVLDVESPAHLQLSSGGFTLPQSGQLSLLRDGDLVAISVAPPSAAGPRANPEHSGMELPTRHRASEGAGRHAPSVSHHSGSTSPQPPGSRRHTEAATPLPHAAVAAAAPAAAATGVIGGSGGPHSSGANKRTRSGKPRSRKADQSVPCLVCQNLLNLKTKVRMSSLREHVASHILSGEIDSSVCGFCGQAGGCNSYMDKGTKSGVVPVSNCPYFYKFSYKTLQKHMLIGRCSNMPILCCACFAPNYVWKYHMSDHWATHHQDLLQAGEMPQEYLISKTEKMRVSALASKHQGRRSTSNLGDSSSDVAEGGDASEEDGTPARQSRQRDGFTELDEAGGCHGQEECSQGWVEESPAGASGQLRDSGHGTPQMPPGGWAREAGPMAATTPPAAAVGRLGRGFSRSASGVGYAGRSSDFEGCRSPRGSFGRTKADTRYQSRHQEKAAPGSPAAAPASAAISQTAAARPPLSPAVAAPLACGAAAARRVAVPAPSAAFSAQCSSPLAPCTLPKPAFAGEHGLPAGCERSGSVTLLEPVTPLFGRAASAGMESETQRTPLLLPGTQQQQQQQQQAKGLHPCIVGAGGKRRSSGGGQSGAYADTQTAVPGLRGSPAAGMEGVMAAGGVDGGLTPLASGNSQQAVLQFLQSSQSLSRLLEDPSGLSVQEQLQLLQQQQQQASRGMLGALWPHAHFMGNASPIARLNPHGSEQHAHGNMHVHGMHAMHAEARDCAGGTPAGGAAPWTQGMASMQGNAMHNARAADAIAVVATAEGGLDAHGEAGLQQRGYSMQGAATKAADLAVQQHTQHRTQGQAIDMEHDAAGPFASYASMLNVQGQEGFGIMEVHRHGGGQAVVQLHGLPQAAHAAPSGQLPHAASNPQLPGFGSARRGDITVAEPTAPVPSFGMGTNERQPQQQQHHHHHSSHRRTHSLSHSNSGHNREQQHAPHQLQQQGQHGGGMEEQQQQQHHGHHRRNHSLTETHNSAHVMQRQEQQQLFVHDGHPQQQQQHGAQQQQQQQHSAQQQHSLLSPQQGLGNGMSDMPASYLHQQQQHHQEQQQQLQLQPSYEFLNSLLIDDSNSDESLDTSPGVLRTGSGSSEQQLLAAAAGTAGSIRHAAGPQLPPAPAVAHVPTTGQTAGGPGGLHGAARHYTKGPTTGQVVRPVSLKLVRLVGLKMGTAAVQGGPPHLGTPDSGTAGAAAVAAGPVSQQGPC